MQDEEQGTPTRVAWSPAFETGHADIDAQHQELLAQCNRLADLAGEGAQAPFDEAFAGLKALVRAHFEAEAALLAGAGDAVLEDHGAEGEEFEVLAGEIATTENFDRLELQRFVAVWCLGHVTASARQLSAGSDPAA